MILYTVSLHPYQGSNREFCRLAIGRQGIREMKRVEMQSAKGSRLADSGAVGSSRTSKDKNKFDPLPVNGRVTLEHHLSHERLNDAVQMLLRQPCT